MEIFQGANSLHYLTVAILVGMLAERIRPWRRNPFEPMRWLRNALMNFYSIILIGLVPFLSSAAAAIFARENNLGVFNLADIPLWAGMIVTLIAIDLTAFVQHRALHQWYFLWRIHRAHHTDKNIDATTALRFHPLESIFRSATEILVILLLGLPPEGIAFAYGVLLIVTVYLHANFYLPVAVEKFLSKILITPRGHRLHHSTQAAHQFSNFGTLTSIWDRLAGSWTSPEHLRDDEEIGVTGAEDMVKETFGNLVLDPFRKRPVGSNIPRPGLTIKTPQQTLSEKA